jgi:hypothetical protein
MQQLDTETNVTEHYTLRELYVIQLIMQQTNIHN